MALLGLRLELNDVKAACEELGWALHIICRDDLRQLAGGAIAPACPVGILYTADEASQAAQRARGGSISETTGTGTWELPQPTVVVIGPDHRVKFVDVSLDCLVRTEAEPVIARGASLGRCRRALEAIDRKRGRGKTYLGLKGACQRVAYGRNV